MNIVMIFVPPGFAHMINIIITHLDVIKKKNQKKKQLLRQKLSTNVVHVQTIVLYSDEHKYT